MTVVLKNKQAFYDILSDYKPDQESVRLLKEIPLVILLGMSGGGRNTIINQLVKTGKYKFIVSDTTRPPKVRDGKLEQDGVNYHFRTEEEMLEDLRAGKFLEAEVIHDQQVSGISIRELFNVRSSGKIPINEVDIGGTDAILLAKPDTKFFFIVPPDYSEWMKRLNARETMSDQELNNRLKTAVIVLKRALEEPYFTFILNDNFDEACQRLDNAVHFGRDTVRHNHARQVATDILKKITDEIS